MTYARGEVGSRAADLILAGRHREALEVLEKEVHPSSATQGDLRLVSLKMSCLTALDRHAEAVTSLRELLSGRRGWAAGWVALARVHLDLCEYEQALRCLEDDAKGTKNLRRGCPRALRDQANDLRQCVVQVRDSGKTEHERGNAAYGAGEFRRAARHYERAVNSAEASGRAPSESERETLGVLHSNLSACYVQLGHQDVASGEAMFRKALRHAELCIHLRPGWQKALKRREDAVRALGCAAGDDLARSLDDSLELGGRGESQGAARAPSSNTRSREDPKAEGDRLFKRSDYAGAEARYTEALEDEGSHHHRAKLFSNRSACRAKLGRWLPALQDGQTALKLSPKWYKAWMRVACAMEGLGNVLDAYCVYCKGLGQCEEALELWRAAASLLPRVPITDTHVSLRPGTRAMERFKMDSTFPRNRTRVFAISDIHIDQHGNVGWVKGLSEENFKNDVVMIAGDVGDTMNALKICLKEFKKRFRRVFFCPGNHDLWVRRDTSDRMYPDSIAKLAAMHNVCQEVGADMGPAEVAQGVFVVPMFSWYNHQFDEGDPHPGGLRYDSFCEWPQALGGHLEVWKYFIKLNASRVAVDYKKGYRGEGDPCVLSMSHFLPRVELPFSRGVTELAKAVGCKELDLQIQQIDSDVHVFGHSHVNIDTTCGDRETRYVQSALEGGGDLYKIFDRGHLAGGRL